MALQIFGTPRCQETKKAERFFKERGIAFQSINLAEKGMSPGELRSVAAALGIEALPDREGRRWKERGLDHMVIDLEETLLADPLLLRTPILRDGRVAAIGAERKVLEEFAAAAKR
jgi:arsenate reductase (glutaredoxin)